MILAAGFGTRLKPLTDNIPKALVEYKRIPMIIYQIEKLKSLNVSKIIVNAHHHSAKLVEYFQNHNFDIDIIVLVENELLGTGGGIINAKEYLNGEDTLVINTDVVTDLSLKEFIDFAGGNTGISTLLVQKRETKRYLEFDSDMKLLCRENENSVKENLFAFNGVHHIKPDFFLYKCDKGYCDIFSLYLKMLSENRKIYGFDAGDSKFLDIGKIENLIN